MNNKASIGTGFTWMAATILIAFMIFTFLVFGVVPLSKNYFKGGLFGSDREQIYFSGNNDLGVNNNVLLIMEESKKEVSLWADDSVLYTHRDFLNNKPDENFDKLCDKVKSYSSIIDFKENILYLSSGEESFILEHDRYNNQPICIVKPLITPGVYKTVDEYIKSDFYFITNNGNVVRVVYGEKGFV